MFEYEKMHEFEDTHRDLHKAAILDWFCKRKSLESVIEAYCARRVADALDEQFTLRERRTA